jgi:hypothetical protein
MWRPRGTAAIRLGLPIRQYHSMTLRRGLADSEIDVRQAAPGMSSYANATNDLNRADLFKTALSQDDPNGQTTHSRAEPEFI